MQAREGHLLRTEGQRFESSRARWERPAHRRFLRKVPEQRRGGDGRHDGLRSARGRHPLGPGPQRRGSRRRLPTSRSGDPIRPSRWSATGRCRHDRSLRDLQRRGVPRRARPGRGRRGDVPRLLRAHAEHHARADRQHPEGALMAGPPTGPPGHRHALSPQRQRPPLSTGAVPGCDRL
jgi:hypothetical protein